MDTHNIARATSKQHDLPVKEIQWLIDESRTLDVDRRNRGRHPMCCPMRLIPIDHNGIVLDDQSIKVSGKDISMTGIGILHEAPLSSERAIISFNHPKIGLFAVEALIVWTRQTPLGIHESGCRMINGAAGKHGWAGSSAK